MHERDWPVRWSISALMLGAGLLWLASILMIPLGLAGTLSLWRVPVIMLTAGAAAAVIGYAAMSVIPHGALRSAASAAFALTAVVGGVGILLLAVLGDEQKLFGFFDQEWLWWYAYIAYMTVMTPVAGVASWVARSPARVGWGVVGLGAACQGIIGVLWTLRPSAVNDLMVVGAVVFGAGALVIGVVGTASVRRRHRWHDHLWGEHSSWSGRWG